MQLQTTRPSIDLALVAIVVVAAGVIFRQPAVVSWGGGLVVGLAIARAVTLVGVSQVRAAGFEMLWREEHRVVRTSRGRTVKLRAEVRNRDQRAVRYVGLRAIASPNLDVRLSPAEGEVPGGGRLEVDVLVTARRVGRHGVHGLSLEVRGGPGLFEVPLTFANPFGIEVLPAAYSSLVSPARGSLSKVLAERGRTGRVVGDSGELKEVRDLQPGDSFKRIAWKASARRGKLLVREYEIEERDIAWVILDASVESWAGEPGTAPLDHAIDDVASVVTEHIRQGDRVGLAIVAGRTLAWVEPAAGKAHAGKLLLELAMATATLDVDRSYYDETDLATRVLEHMRPLDPQASRGVRSRQIERVARRADLVVARGPFRDVDPVPRNGIDRSLRRYVAAFGINIPPRLEPERERTDARLIEALQRLSREKPRPSVIYVCSPAPSPYQRRGLHDALARLPRRYIKLRWIDTRDTDCLAPTGSELEVAVRDALRLRSEVSRIAGSAALRLSGVRSVPTRGGSTHPPAGT